MHSLTSTVLDLILARVCAGCGHPGSMMCDPCATLLQPRPRPRRALDVGDLVSDLRVPVVCSLDYRGPVRQMLNAYKDDGQRSLTPWLAPALLASINHALITCVSTHQMPTLVPVPTRKKPLVGAAIPESTSSNSDWPLPDTPAMPTISPSLKVREMSLSWVMPLLLVKHRCWVCRTVVPGCAGV